MQRLFGEAVCLRPSGQSLGSPMADMCGRGLTSQGQGAKPFPQPEEKPVSPPA